MLLLNSEDVCFFFFFFCGHVLVNVIDIGYFHSVYFYICCLLLHFPPGLGSKICQSWPEKKNISAAVGCLHETACRRHLNISSICYPSWPKLSLSFTARFRLRFQLPKTLCWLSRTWHEEKRCRCKDFPFYSINILFIGRACLSEEQEYLYPFISDAGWLMTWSLWIRMQALVSSLKYVRRFTSQVFTSMTSNSVWFSNSQPISVWKCNIPICDSYSALLMDLHIGGWSLGVRDMSSSL